MSFFETEHELLFEYSGATAKSLRYFNSQPESWRWFKPYEGVYDAGFRIASIFIAPVCLSAIAVNLWMTSVYHGLKSLCYDLPLGGVAAALDSMAAALAELMGAIVFLAAAILSPFLNALDAIGACFTAHPAPESSMSLHRKEDDVKQRERWSLT